MLTVMEKHYGQIVEYIVRKNGYNISDLSRSLNMNRRSLYNWFANEALKKDIIYRIGCVIRHDFSKEFPELFSKEEFVSLHRPPQLFINPVAESEADEEEYYKEKYLTLLESYNNMLMKTKSYAEVRLTT